MTRAHEIIAQMRRTTDPAEQHRLRCRLERVYGDAILSLSLDRMIDHAAMVDAEEHRVMSLIHSDATCRAGVA